MEQYLRKVRVTFTGNGGSLVVNGGGMNLHELKVSFSVAKGISSTPNTAEIKIWNLSESSRNAIGKELDNAMLEAGYMPPGGGDNVGVIFKGEIRDVEHTREGPDIITTVSCGDGDKGVRKAKLAKTYPAGTEVETVVSDLHAELEAKGGIARGEWKFGDEATPFKRPYTVCGGCKNELDILSRGKGFYWNIQNEAMEIIPSDEFIGGIIVLSAETGLVEVPTITDNGVKAKALLNPEVRPNRRVRIISQVLEMNAEGSEYRVSECTFSGDNREGNFLVDITGEAIKGSKVDEGTWK